MKFLNALKGINESSPPVWFMRQAGRYLPEYMEIKNQSNFKQMSQTPELIKTITLQPLKRYSLDAAILFSDILTCLDPMGAPFEFTEKGPKLDYSGPEALKSLKSLNPEKDLSFVGDGIRLIKEELTDKPLIGFVGAPFTLASYLVEGGTSREFPKLRRFIYENPSEFTKSLETLSIALAKHLKYQINSGVNAVQIFDSWVGILSLDTYNKMILPIMKDLISEVKSYGVPVILYSQPTTHLLPALVQSGAHALSVDWRLNIKDLSKRLQDLDATEISIQGNLDPIAMTQDWNIISPQVEKILEDLNSSHLKKQFIFNVGHGLTPESKPETVEKVIQFVQNKP